MDNVIVADKNGKELRTLVFSEFDFEVGHEENSFHIKILRSEYESIPKEARIYIPGTEYGGLFRRLETNTDLDTISPGGLTWRGMMKKKIIQPASGADYATDSGELNAIVKRRVEAALPGLFKGVSTSTGVTVSWQYDRYCTLEEGLRKMLKSKGCRLDISYSQTEKAVIVSAVPIVDYSQDIELSSDMRLNYIMQMQGDGVNHLILLGNGELKDRVVRHLYVNASGNIVTTPYYTGVDEIAEIYDYAGAELTDLLQSGEQQLREVMNRNEFMMTMDPETEIAIGDVVGGRDYLSGMTMTAPVTGKIVRWQNGMRTIEYQLSDDVTATIEDASLLTVASVSKTEKLETLETGISLKAESKEMTAEPEDTVEEITEEKTE